MREQTLDEIAKEAAEEVGLFPDSIPESVVIIRAAILKYHSKDSERLDWLEANKIKIEPPSKSYPDWFGIFFQDGFDTGGNGLRNAIDAAMTRKDL